MRNEHLLRAAKSDAYPTNIVCLACEHTWKRMSGQVHAETAILSSWVGVGFSGASGVYGKEKWCEGTTAASFWECLYGRIKKGGKVSIFCERADHTCALLELWSLVERREIDLCGTDERGKNNGRSNGFNPRNMRAVLESPPFIIEGKPRGAKGKFKILDIANYGLQPSAEGVSASEICNRLAAFVREMIAALKLRGMGSLKDTVGTQSMYSFRRANITHPVLCHDNTNALNLEGDSYYGGRCEAFRLGRIMGPIYHLDVHSMYPYCARENHVPVSLAGFNAELGAGDQPQLGEVCGLIADVLVETDEPCYPYRDMSRGIITWPIGVFRTTLAGPELQDALTNDRVVRWHRAAWYHMKPALASYSRCVLDMRREYEGKEDLKTWSKSLGVCLIGKLGQRDRYWEDEESNVFHGPWQTWWEYRRNEGWIRFRSISNYTQAEMISGFTYDAVPAIASWVTSMARMRLLAMLRCAGWLEVYYCDTDALMVSNVGLTNLERAGWVREGEPGYLRIKNVSDIVDIHGVKSYDEEGRSVSAGRPVAVASAVPGEVRYWTRRTAIGACREGRAPQALRVSIAHQRTSKYEHGEVCADGTVIPFQLNEG